MEKIDWKIPLYKIYADIEDVICGLNPNLIKSKINKKIKAIIPVDISGTACDILKLKKLEINYTNT